MQRSNLPADDIVAITQTVHLYGHVLDGRLWSWLPEVFTPDGVFDMSHEPGTEVGGVRLEGIPAIAEAFGRIQHALAHHVSNVFIFQDGEQTRSLCKFFMPDAKGRFHVRLRAKKTFSFTAIKRGFVRSAPIRATLGR